jgi:transposase
MGQRTVGIDLAIRGDHVARILDDGRPSGRLIRFRLTPDSLAGLVARVCDGLAPGDTVTAVMEPTGMAWFPVAHWLERAGVRVIRVKGQRVRALRRYLSEHAKTDTVDAYVLGAIPLFGGVAADPVYVPSAERHALQRLTRQRERLEDEVTAIKRRLLDLVRWACPALEAVLPEFRTNLALAVLHDLLDPARVAKARRATLLRFVAQHARSRASSLGSAARSRRSTADCTRRMPCAPSPASATPSRRSCSACCTRRGALRACGGSGGSAACSHRPAHPAAPTSPARRSLSPATTGSSARSTWPPTPHGASTRSWPRSTGD